MQDDENIKGVEKGLNLRIQEAREDIADTINKTKLAPGIVLMILNEFTLQTQAQNAQMIATERKAYEEEVKKIGKEIHKDRLGE
jgi:hypothetical protein